jgi:hypothetical protein
MRDPGVRAVRAPRWPEGARAELCLNLGDGADQDFRILTPRLVAERTT